ncbi:MAG TPA: SDR family oxidoreductase [Solirubrobacteraceae bacterium]|jgi:NAD(P)-dependent dehydrogenase (short-subunit alcohol dehydrogenase family)|nr:SDR family oxidoreductase [Solirubrobacteraceae bacterium]
MAHFDLNGKTALVTGAGRGIGNATARALLARGASVALVDLNQEQVERAAAELHESRALGIGGDVTDRATMQRAVATTVERFGGLDLVVANAGIAPRVSTFKAMSSESFERVLDVNLWGVYRTVDAALPAIVQRRGHVVVISSIYAFMNGVGATPYAMSKAAVEQFGRALRVELAPHGASAGVVYFGFIETDMVHGAIDADPIAAELYRVLPGPLRKRLPAKDAGEAIARGIERRQAQVFLPRRWGLVSLLRGIFNPLSDLQLQREARAQELVRRMDDRTGSP